MNEDKLDKLLEYSARHDERLGRVEIDTGEIKFQVKATNGRVRDLEVWKSQIKGQIAVIVGIFSLGINFVWQFIRDRINS